MYICFSYFYQLLFYLFFLQRNYLPSSSFIINIFLIIAGIFFLKWAKSIGGGVTYVTILNFSYWSAVLYLRSRRDRSAGSGTLFWSRLYAYLLPPSPCVVLISTILIYNVCIEKSSDQLIAWTKRYIDSLKRHNQLIRTLFED